jgi:hypothetical protein
MPAEARLDRLAPVLADPVRAVRIAAAKAMIGATPTGASDAALASLSLASDEWHAALSARLDFPETHLQVGGAALGTRNVPVADAAFREAVDLDPQLVDGWIMIARIHAATGDPAGARDALDAALAANPGHPDLVALRAQFGP